MGTPELDAISAKLDLVLANQQKQAEKYENYSAFFRKKLNDSFEMMTKALTAQSVVLTDGIARLERTLKAQAQTAAPDANYAELLRQLSELTQSVQEISAAQTELTAHHAALLGKAVADGFRQINALQDTDMQLQQEGFARLSAALGAPKPADGPEHPDAPAE
ncbi:MAG: hypothetical protein II723_03515 [Oscillospiraceae bacterium]|nr:hypothetical protein [Oscillospiraceae bacterium]